MCWTPSYTRHGMKKYKAKNTTQYVLDTIIHKTRDEDKQSKKYNIICVGHHHTQDTGMVSNIYCVVFFALFVFIPCLVYDGVQHILCCIFCFVYTRHGMKTNKAKNTTQYVLDTTIRKQTQIT
jgi:hypothetical protein